MISFGIGIGLTKVSFEKIILITYLRINFLEE